MTPAKRILIVDDDVDFVEALSSFLEVEGYVVSRAYDGREALKRAKLERPDLIIMDIVMDERTEGFFTIHEIRHTPALRSVPLFVVTSLYADGTRFPIQPETGWLAHDAVFSKPLDMPRLADRIRSALDDSQCTTPHDGGEDVA